MFKRSMSVLLSVVMIISSFMAMPTALAKQKSFAKSLKLSKSSITLQVGSKAIVKATVKVKGSAKKAVSVVSSAKGVAIAKAGSPNKKGVSTITITAKKAGKTSITVTTKAKNARRKMIKKNISVTVKVAENSDSQKEDSKTDNNKTDDSKQDVVIDPKVEWTTVEEPYTGTASISEGQSTTSVDLMRKYVSFNPWPTTDEQVQYVIKKCNDPWVIAALYVVALDNISNYEYKSLNDTTCVTFAMLNSLMSGAGTLTDSTYKLNNFDIQHINEFCMKQSVIEGGGTVLTSSFASRAYLKGATPSNNYTPEGGLTDKTKWQIMVDEYVYCGDLANGYISLCPRRYSEYQETEGSVPNPKEHPQVCIIGFRWNKTYNVWCPTDYAKLNTNPGSSALVPYNVKASVLFSNNYVPPKQDQGF